MNEASKINNCPNCKSEVNFKINSVRRQSDYYVEWEVAVYARIHMRKRMKL